ncbi:MAG TPA: L-aspartate oxidase [Candidatus Acidoferrales bacterium]|nr:L-aspartate oxidase [Candidatus Acidoferrales bacterium]
MHPDFLVIGAGVAGMRAAIELAEAGTVLVVAKDSLRESSSEYAQGGIAVALGDDDEIQLHEQDTMAAGDGLCDRAAVRTLVEEGPAAVQELIEWGAEFDREGGRLAFTREGAHSRNRVLHAHGDSTGREIARTLYRKAASLPNVAFRSFATIDELLLDEGVCGAVLEEPIRARAVLLATGGLGRLYLHTTNPDVATGDGVAMAYRAGAEISDIEFVQFHPTALAMEGAPNFLISEALRGEGARLKNAQGGRFTDELAPRDVVARAIVNVMRREETAHVFLDISQRGEAFVRERFPRIFETCLRYGINLGRDAVPVAPAAHYAMGGVRTDLKGRTSIRGLFAAGEVACTGVHGANRLASNSLLEGVVFGKRAGRAMREAGAVPEARSAEGAGREPAPHDAVPRLMWDYCGIDRDAAGLQRACAEFESLQATVPLLIARCALARQESRGAHFRGDFPQKRAEFARHSIVLKDTSVTFS